jgi:alginate O-acetyltransferase complex protein AlgI
MLVVATYLVVNAATLTVGVSVDLAVLGFYKYTDFALRNVVAALTWAGQNVQLPPPSIILPLGLSFFTFEFIHYLVDVRRGQQAVRSPIEFAVFAAFFPTQIAGPIKRFENFIPQIERPPSFDWGNVGAGARLIVIGLFKKVALADNLAPIVALGFAQFGAGKEPLSAGDTWLVVLGFAIQIYCDFSGYTDMGRGSALLLGFTVPENFNRPYLAANISEFWRRWHMSLSTWLRDYLYIPLGGNRRGRNRNLLLTMILGGLWHGANWTFVVWGAYHGLLLVGYWALRARWEPGQRLTSPFARGALMVGGIVVTGALVCIGWVFFRAPNLEQALAMIGAMFGWGAGHATVVLASQRATVAVIVGGLLLVESARELWASGWGESPLGRPRVPRAFAAWQPELQAIGCVALFALTLIAQPPTNPPFIYFQF